MPADDHLGRALVVLGRDTGDHPVFQQLALAQRAPGGGDDPLLRVEGAQFRLLPAGVQLDLVGGRRHAGLADDAFQVGDGEVGHADGPGPALLAQPHQGLPAVEVEVLGRGRPVDQVEVDIVHAEPAQALVEGGQGRVVALVLVPQLGGDEELVAGDPRALHALPHTGLVAIGRGGVDGPVAGLQRRRHGVGGGVGRALPDPQANLGHGAAIVERQEGLGGHGGHQAPTLGIETQGSAGALAGPACSNSTEMPSGERTKAMWPSRGGRLMVTPPACSRAQVS